MVSETFAWTYALRHRSMCLLGRNDRCECVYLQAVSLCSLRRPTDMPRQITWLHAFRTRSRVVVFRLDTYRGVSLCRRLRLVLIQFRCRTENLYELSHSSPRHICILYLMHIRDETATNIRLPFPINKIRASLCYDCVATLNWYEIIPCEKIILSQTSTRMIGN